MFAVTKLKREVNMFYEVRVFNAQKSLKKIISRKELSRKYWNEFEEKQRGIVAKKSQKITSLNSKLV